MSAVIGNNRLWQRRKFTIATCFVAASCLTPVAYGQIKFVTPLSGVPFHDWAIGGYNDVDPRPGAYSDFRNGSYTYDGHDALDIGLPHFRRMDEGVQVLAAAAGVVRSARDGAFDRWTGSNPAPPGEVGNLIIIDHGGGTQTTYAHLKMNSIKVEIGDRVEAGQVLADVGSSGQSSGPHLHFAVYQDGRPIETYLNPELWWYDPLPYTGDVSGVLDVGVSDHWPTSSEIEYGILPQPVFPRTDSHTQLAVMWQYFFGIPDRADVSFSFRRPNGTIFWTTGWTVTDGPAGGGYWNVGAEIPASRHPGIWNAEFRVNGQLLSSRSFQVVGSVPEPSTVCLIGIVMVLGCFMQLRPRVSSQLAWEKPCS
jgi:hypothetical protein